MSGPLAEPGALDGALKRDVMRINNFSSVSQKHDALVNMEHSNIKQHQDQPSITLLLHCFLYCFLFVFL